jgi:hypothetical protein
LPKDLIYFHVSRQGIAATMMRLGLFVCTASYLVLTVNANVVPLVDGDQLPLDETSCKASTAGYPFLDLDNFAAPVSHGIHSITIEDIEYFFQVPNVSEFNGIPTDNTNLSDVDNPILYNAPHMVFDHGFKTPGMRAMDEIMTRGNEEFVFMGTTVLEKIGHALHMHELFAGAALAYQEVLKNPPNAQNKVCECINDVYEAGVFRALGGMGKYVHERHGRMLYRSDVYNGVVEDRKRREVTEDEHAEDSQHLHHHEDDSTNQHLLNGPEDWAEYKKLMMSLMLDQKGLNNLAVYLYCKLVYFGTGDGTYINM